MPEQVVKEQKVAQINHVDILQPSYSGVPEISSSAPKVTFGSQGNNRFGSKK